MNGMIDIADTPLMAALLEWQLELGADEAMGDGPVNRYDLPAAATAPVPQPVAAPSVARGSASDARGQIAPPPAPVQTGPDPVALARALAAAAPDLAALAAAQQAFDHCEVKRGARSFVFADGRPGARVMILGEAPGRDEDMQGLPFVGRAGQFLDRMFAAIGMSRHDPDPGRALYITNVMPWRPPANRDPAPEEMAMMLPFVKRHVELAAPEFLVLMGNTPCAAILGQRGITRLRGIWTQALGLPVLPMLHPAYLLRSPEAKRGAWADLLTLQARLRSS